MGRIFNSHYIKCRLHANQESSLYILVILERCANECIDVSIQLAEFRILNLNLIVSNLLSTRSRLPSYHNFAQSSKITQICNLEKKISPSLQASFPPSGHNWSLCQQNGGKLTQHGHWLTDNWGISLLTLTGHSLVSLPLTNQNKGILSCSYTRPESRDEIWTNSGEFITSVTIG